MALTPNIMMAVEGLLAEIALAIVPVDTASYTSQAIVADYLTTLSVYQRNLYDAVTNEDGIQQSLIDAFIHALDDSAPYLTNAVPVAAGIRTTFYTTLFDKHVSNLFPSNGQFIQYALIAMGHVATANQYINSAISGQKLAAQTFTSSDALISGNISSVSTNIQVWGRELIDSGALFNFAKLDNIGTPQAIIESLIQTHTLRSISVELAAQGIDTAQLQKAIIDNPELTLKPLTQKRCYDAFVAVTGDKLTDILNAMHMVTTGITTLADLLDLTKVFPTTYTTITTPNNGPLENIYTGGSISSFVDAFAPASTAYMPPDQAKANYAFSIALEQIKGIRTSTPEKIGTTAAGIESNAGLDNTDGLTTSLPAATSDAIIESLGGGSGPDGTFYLSDLIGAPAAIPENSVFARIVELLDTIQADGGFVDIAEILSVMRNLLNNVYLEDDELDPPTYHHEIPVGTPGAGTYFNKSDAISTLLNRLNLAVAAYIAAYPTEHVELFELFTTLFDSVIEGIKQLWDADLRFEVTYVPGYETLNSALDGLPTNKKVTLAFGESLPSFGKKTSKHDIAEILETLATDTLGGNAIIAAMREARNSDKLAEAGVTGDNQLSDQPSVVEPGNIS